MEDNASLKMEDWPDEVAFVPFVGSLYLERLGGAVCCCWASPTTAKTGGPATPASATSIGRVIGPFHAA